MSLENFLPILKMSDIPGKMEYEFKTSKPSKGQRKLLYAEILFFNVIGKEINKSKPTHIIYAGAAHGFKFPIIADMVSNITSVTWHLYDPSNFANVVIPSEQVNIYQKEFEPTYFLENELKIDRKDINLILMSDIRYSPDTENIIHDHGLHDHWIDVLNPDFCWLKWRLPYFENENDKLEYYESSDIVNNLYLQIYAKTYSGECRMIIKGKQYSKVVLDRERERDYEEYLYYYNSVIRKDENFEYNTMIYIVNEFNKLYGTKYLINDLNKQLALNMAKGIRNELLMQ